MKNRIFSKLSEAFTMTNNMASSGLLENVIVTNIIHYTDGNIGYAKSETCSQIVQHLIVGAGLHTHQFCKMLTQSVQYSCTPVYQGAVGQVQWGTGVGRWLT